ncbi:hypothetical protein QQ045_006103 [Rhodiola kirilowii]
MIHEDDFMRQMGNEMSAKFQNWSDYSLTLGIAVLMDPRYMMSFVEWAYIKLHGENPLEVVMFKDTLNSLYEVYVHRWSSQMRDAHILKMKIHNFSSRLVSCGLTR